MIDYCNAVLNGTPSHSIKKLQQVQNNAVRTFLDAPRRAQDAQRQPVVEDVTLAASSAEDLIDYKVALLTFKVRSTSTPSYLRRPIQDRQHSHNLRSATTTLCQPSTSTRSALTDALLRLFGTHYRKLSLIWPPGAFVAGYCSAMAVDERSEPLNVDFRFFKGRCLGNQGFLQFRFFDVTPKRREICIGRLSNLSLQTGKFPARYKRAQVLPLLKKAGLDSSQPANYRPISNLPTVSKVLEKLVLACLRPQGPTCSALPTSASSSLHRERDIPQRLHYWRSWTESSRRPTTSRSLS